MANAWALSCVLSASAWSGTRFLPFTVPMVMPLCSTRSEAASEAMSGWWLLRIAVTVPWLLDAKAYSWASFIHVAACAGTEGVAAFLEGLMRFGVRAAP